VGGAEDLPVELNGCSDSGTLCQSFVEVYSQELAEAERYLMLMEANRCESFTSVHLFKHFY
jgi:hypothetical protein